jgi:hypothetical protein
MAVKEALAVAVVVLLGVVPVKAMGTVVLAATVEE